RTNAMHAVTTDAGCNSRFSFFFQELAVHAGVILALLVHPQRRIESLHQIRVAMTLPAVSWNIERLWFPEVALVRILRSLFCIGIRIAAMTIIAGHTALFMHVFVDQFRAGGDASVLRLVVPSAT